MKCDNCKKNEASFHSITNINGKITEKHLCLDCAKQDSNFIDKKENIFNDFISDFKTSLSFFSPVSSFNFDDFFEDDFFNFPKTNMLNSREIENNKSKQTEIEKIRQNELSKQAEKQRELNKLDLQLKKAVVEERYEDAIVLRDKIKALKNEK